MPVKIFLAHLQPFLVIRLSLYVLGDEFHPIEASRAVFYLMRCALVARRWRLSGLGDLLDSHLVDVVHDSAILEIK